jgi:hypothetical protein
MKKVAFARNKKERESYLNMGGRDRTTWKKAKHGYNIYDVSEGVTPLPVVKIGGKKYYVDERLNELRNVKNPHDREKMEGSAEFYVRHFGVKRKLRSMS